MNFLPIFTVSFFMIVSCSLYSQSINDHDVSDLKHDPSYIMEPEMTLDYLTGVRKMPLRLSKYSLFYGDILPAAFKNGTCIPVDYYLGGNTSAVQTVVRSDNRRKFYVNLQRDHDRFWQIVAASSDDGIGVNIDNSKNIKYSALSHTNNFTDIIPDLKKVLLSSKGVRYSLYNDTKIVYSGVVFKCSNGDELIYDIQLEDVICNGSNDVCGWVITKIDQSESRGGSLSNNSKVKLDIEPLPSTSIPLVREPDSDFKVVNKRDSEGEVFRHKVKRGDTLYKLSKRYNVEQSKIIKANKLKSDQINIGDKLIIPFD